MKPISLVYFGTDEFAAGLLHGLLLRPELAIAGVVTQPDRPVGRKQIVTPSPVAVAAESAGLPLFRPISLKKDPSTLPAADIFLVYRYGLLIPPAILALPSRGTLNIHPSLLPRYRGATPLQTSIMNGDQLTGVTIILMDEQLDHGPILSQQEIAIAPNDTYLELSQKINKILPDLTVSTIVKWTSQSLAPHAQDESAATFCPLFRRETGRLDFTLPSEQLYNLYRGLTPWPGVYTTWHGQRLKILRLHPHPRPGVPSQVAVKDGRLFIGCGDQQSLELLELQLEGKKPFDAKTFINGHAAIHGALLNS